MCALVDALLKYHPDRSCPEPTKEECTAKFIKVSEAYVCVGVSIPKKVAGRRRTSPAPYDPCTRPCRADTSSLCYHGCTATQRHRYNVLKDGGFKEWNGPDIVMQHDMTH